jgi:DNA-binding MarR family transcriptional regulator
MLYMQLMDTNKRQTYSATQIADTCVAVRARLISRTISRTFDAALRPFGVSTAQMNILVAVQFKEQASAKEISAVLALEKSTVSRNVQIMIAKGWLHETPQIGRKKLLTVTDAGSSLLEDLSDAWAGAQTRVINQIGDTNVAALDDTATRLRSLD